MFGTVALNYFTDSSESDDENALISTVSGGHNSVRGLEQRQHHCLYYRENSRLYSRILRDATNILELPEQKFFRYFRVSKEIFSMLLEELIRNLPPTYRSTHVPAQFKLAKFLAFIATGVATIDQEYELAMCKSQVSKTICEILDIFEQHLYTKWVAVTQTEDEEFLANQYFFKNSGLAGVVGCVDNFHVRIRAPEKKVKNIYYNSKGFPSLNVLIMCDHNIVIKCVDANQPGSYHNAYIWDQCIADNYLRTNHKKGKTNTCVVGNTGYNLLPYLLVPYKNPKEEHQRFFNEKLYKARHIIKQCVRTLKNRFSCLKTPRGLFYSPEKAVKIVISCCILHNICIAYKNKCQPTNNTDYDESDSEDDDSKSDISFEECEAYSSNRDEVALKLINSLPTKEILKNLQNVIKDNNKRNDNRPEISYEKYSLSSSVKHEVNLISTQTSISPKLVENPKVKDNDEIFHSKCGTSKKIRDKTESEIFEAHQDHNIINTDNNGNFSRLKVSYKERELSNFIKGEIDFVTKQPIHDDSTSVNIHNNKYNSDTFEIYYDESTQSSEIKGEIDFLSPQSFLPSNTSQNHQNCHSESKVNRLHIDNLRRATDILDLPDDKFVKTFRVSKEIFSILLEEIAPKAKIAYRCTHTPISIKLATLLSFLATGGYLATIEYSHKSCLSKSQVSKTISEMLDIFEEHFYTKWINTDQNREDEVIIKEHFYKLSGIPDIIGCIDNTHIQIKTPTKQLKSLYYNRNDFYSLNVMMICDHNMIIKYVDANQPGSYHDAYVWEQSSAANCLKINLLTRKSNAFLIGDSAYKLQPYMMIPYKNPRKAYEYKFNEKHNKIRKKIQTCISILKNRFRCLVSNTGLQYTPEKASKIITTCCILHNICIHYKNHWLPCDEATEDVVDEGNVIETANVKYALSIRNEIARNL